MSILERGEKDHTGATPRGPYWPTWGGTEAPLPNGTLSSAPFYFLERFRKGGQEGNNPREVD